MIRAPRSGPCGKGCAEPVRPGCWTPPAVRPRTYTRRETGDQGGKAGERGAADSGDAAGPDPRRSPGRPWPSCLASCPARGGSPSGIRNRHRPPVPTSLWWYGDTVRRPVAVPCPPSPSPRRCRCWPPPGTPPSPTPPPAAGARRRCTPCKLGRARAVPARADRRWDHDAWRAEPLDAEDVAQLRAVAAAMPPEAYAVPRRGRTAGPELPEPEGLVRAFLDAVAADVLPRTPAARARRGTASAARAPQRLPGAARVGRGGGGRDGRGGTGVAAARPVGVRGVRPGRRRGVRRTGLRRTVRLRRAPADGAAGDTGAEPAMSRRRRAGVAVVQVHSLADPTLVADAAELWAGDGDAASGRGPGSTRCWRCAGRRAGLAAAADGCWTPPARRAGAVRGRAVRLLGGGGRAPRRRGRRRALAEGAGPGADRAAVVVRPAPRPARTTSFFVGERAAGLPLAGRPRGGSSPRRRWTPSPGAPADRAAARPVGGRGPGAGPPKARSRGAGASLTPIDALGAALTGSAEVDGEQVGGHRGGALEELRSRIADPEPAPRASPRAAGPGRDPARLPAARPELAATG